MTRIVAFLLLATPAAFGQFRNLAATDAGDQLYFSTPFRETGSEQHLDPKIFQWSASGGFHLVAQRDPEIDTYPDFYRLIQPDVSGDGSVVTYVGWNPCVGSDRCAFDEAFRANLADGQGGADELGAGRIQVSRNGRYAVVCDSTSARFGEFDRIDLLTGERVPVGTGQIAAERQAVTSNGEVLSSIDGDFGLWTPAGFVPLVPELSVGGPAIISDDGSWLVFNTFDDSGYSLWTVRADGSGAHQLSPARETEYAPAISNDGRWVVFEGDDRVMLADLDAGASQALAEPPDGVAETTISGLGNAVFVATRGNRLLRIDAASGEVEELAGRVPAVMNFFPLLSWFDTPYGVPAVFGAATPGSLNWIRGSGLADELSFAPIPLPETLDGVGVMLGDLPARIVAIAPGQIVYQIPFEAQHGATDARVTGPAVPFEGQPWQLDMQSQQFQFVRNGIEAWTPELPFLSPVVVTQDFTALVTDENPALEEQIVHLYATGAGPVEAAVPTGVPTPAEPLPTVASPVECFYLDAGGRTPLETLYMGLAPGLIGVYQVTVRLPLGPEILPPSPEPVRGLSIVCGAGESERFASVPMRIER